MPVNPFRLALIFSTLALLFILSMFFRVSTAVISKDLVTDLHLNANTLGLLGGGFFYSFALIQVIMGLMLDRVGPRVVIPLCALIGGLGSFLFGFAGSFSVAIAGRIVMGLGMAAVLMGGMKVLTLLFPQDRFATLAGLLVAVGTFGGILAASPLAWVASLAGWRVPFFLAGLLCGLLGILLYFTLRPSGSESAGRNDHTSIATSLGLILSSLRFWQICAIAFVRYGTLVSLQALWLGLYLIDAKGFSTMEAGNVLVAFSAGYVLASPVTGRLYDRFAGHGKIIILLGLGGYTLWFVPLLGLWDVQTRVSYVVIAFFIGAFGTFGTLLYADVKTLFPLSVGATALTWVNLFVMAGGAVLIPLFGRLIERYPQKGGAYPPEAYHLCFLICFLSMMASLAFYAMPSRRPER